MSASKINTIYLSNMDRNNTNLNLKSQGKTIKQTVGKKTLECNGEEKRKRTRAYRPRHRRVESIHDGDVMLGCNNFVESNVNEDSPASTTEMLLREVCSSRSDRDTKREICHIIGKYNQMTPTEVNAYIDTLSFEHAASIAGNLMSDLWDNIKLVCGPWINGDETAQLAVRSTIVTTWTIWQTRHNPLEMMRVVRNYVLTQAPSSVSELLQMFLLGEELPSEQSGEYGESCAMLRDLRFSPLFSYAKVLCSLVCTLGLVPRQEWTISGFRLFLVEPFDSSSTGLPELVDNIFEAMLYFFQRGYACFDKRSLKPFLFTTDEMMEMETVQHKLVMDIRARVQGKDSTDVNGLFTRVRQVREKLSKMTNSVRSADKPILRRLVKLTMEAESDLLAFTKSRSLRYAPLCVKTYGLSSVGKTSFNQITMREILRFNGFDYEDVNLSRIEPEKPFWEHVHNDSTGLIIDDMCNTVASKEKCNPADLLITLVNNQPYSVNRAELADKGQIWINAKVVGITTNNRLLDAHKWSVEPMSVVRRCHLHIDLEVAPEFRNVNGQLDSALAMEAPSTFGYIQDLWLITVNTVVKLGLTTTGAPETFSLKPVTHKGRPLVKVRMLEYLDFLYDCSAKHFAEQKHFVESKTLIMNQSHLCPKTNRVVRLNATLPDSLNEDVKVPSGVVVEDVDDDESVSEQAGLMTNLLLRTFLSSSTSVPALTFIAYCESFCAWLGLPPVWWYTGQIYAIFAIICMPSNLEKFVMKRVVRKYAHEQLSNFERGVLSTAHAASNFYWLLLSEEVFESWGMVYVRCMSHYRYQAAKGQSPIYGVGRWDYCDLVVHALLMLTIQLFYGVQGNIIFCCLYALWAVIRNCVTFVRNIKSQMLRVRATRTKMALHNFNLFDLRLVSNDPMTAEGFCRLCLRGGALIGVLGLLRTIFRFATHCDIDKRVGQDEAPAAQEDIPVRKTTSWSLPGIKILKHGEQGNVLSPETLEDAAKREATKNVWAHSVQYSEKSTSTIDERCNSVKKNLLYIQTTRIEGGAPIGAATFCNAIMLGSNVVMMPYHMWFVRDTENWQPIESMRVAFCRAEVQSSGWVETLHISKGHRVAQHDLIVFPVYGGGVFASVVKHLADKQYVGAVRTLYRSRDGTLQNLPGTSVSTTVSSYNRSVARFSWPSLEIMRDRGWENGDCMTVILSDCANPQIVGFHLLGKAMSMTGSSCFVDRTLLTEFLLGLEEKLHLHSATLIPESVYGVNLGLTPDVHYKSCVNFIEDKNVSVLGSCIGKATYKSEVRQSIISKHVSETLGPRLHGPPPFKGLDGKQPWKPWQTNMEKLARVPVDVSDADLDWAVKDYIKPLIKIAREHVTHMAPLTLEETINGIEGSRMITSMNYATSVGFPLTGPKRVHLDEIGKRASGQSVYAFKTTVFEEEWKVMEEKYVNLECAHPIFKASLKDEPVKIGKDKVRVFQAVGMAMQIGLRKFFMPLVRIMGLYPLISECAVGINPQGLEWEELHNHMSYFGNGRCIAGDYKGWDTSIPAKLILAAFGSLITIARESGGYTLRDCRIMKGLAMDVAYATTTFDGTLVRFHGTNPSGQNLTAHVNSICNSLLLRCAYHRNSGPVYLPFRTNVKLITYGDDFVGSVSENSTFGMIHYARYCKSEVGIVVTTPTKEPITEDYIAMDDVDFLKRKSVFCDELDTHIGVLTLESVNRSLHCTMCSKGDERNVLISTIRSALQEVFFHGRDTYDYYCTVLRRALEELDLHHHQLFIPYDDRVLAWHNLYMSEITSLDSALDDALPEVALDESFEMGGIISGYDSASVASFNRLAIEYNTGLTQHNKLIIQNDHDIFRGGSQVPRSPVEQSGTVTTAETSSSSIVHFDVLDTWSREVLVSRDETFNIAYNNDQTLTDVLKRPIIIHNFKWGIGDNINATIDVLKRYISSSRLIQQKLNNYTFLSGVMCIKVTVNGSPFMYGKTIVAARHWPQISEVETLTLTQVTSLPYVSITPTDGTAGCMEMPLLAPDGGISLIEYSYPLALEIRTIDILRAVKEATAEAEVSIWAWFKDYQLSMPTNFELGTEYKEQGGDEYSMPAASVIATTLAAFLGRLSSWPIVGPYARASEIAVTAGGQIAQLFGYSKPSIVQEPGHMQNMPLSNLSNFNGKDTCVKLALDAKNEVTVDPRVTGYGGPDDMIIRDMCKREALLTKFMWNSDKVRGDVLWRTVVNPGLAPDLGKGTYGDTFAQHRLSPTPLAHASYAFEYWRGTLEFRFEIIASQFHQGKLRVVYEPSSALMSFGSWALEENLLHSRVIDLATEREFVMTVGWGQLQNYLSVAVPYGYTSPMYTGLDSDILAFDPFAWNGCIGIAVTNGLTCADDEPVEVNVYVRAGEDFELQVPSVRHIGRMNTGFPAPIEQGGVIPLGDVPDSGVASEVALKDSDTTPVLVDKLAHIHFGERIVSIRQLLKRYCVSCVYMPPSGVINEDISCRWQINDFPCYPGPDLMGTSNTVFGRWNINSPANYLNYFSPCFLMRRGSIRNKYLVFNNQTDTSAAFYELTAARSNTSGFELGLTNYTNVAFDADMIKDRLANFHLHGAAGSSVAIPGVKPTLEVELPNYNPHRWYFAQDRAINHPYDEPTLDYTRRLRRQTAHILTLSLYTPESSGMTRSIFIRRYTSAGDDFSLHYYCYAPIIYVVDPLNFPSDNA